MDFLRWPVIAIYLGTPVFLLYFIAIGMSGHFRPTPLEEHGPVVLLVAAYAGIGWMLWLSRNRMRA